MFIDFDLLTDEELQELIDSFKAEQDKRLADTVQPKQQYYIFTGEWSWGCYATSEEDAKRQFEDAFYDELSIDDQTYEVRVEDV